jgi:photosystem II stability/assembly factor-like uncharacterized protein
MRYKLMMICLLFTSHFLKAQSIKLMEQGRPTSIRGLSVVNNKVAWASGSKGTIAVTVNGGVSWSWQEVKGYEQSDFRDVEAFSANEAIIMSSGTPAVILKTVNGGVTWKKVYHQDDKAYFLDAMAFANKHHGFVLGDPIDGKFLLLETIDGGETWNRFAVQPNALPGEAAFAASGTCLSVSNIGYAVTIVTGGSSSRKISISKSGVKTDVLPITQGKASRGAFSYASGAQRQVIVGGDYELNKRIGSVACYLVKGKMPRLVEVQPKGYQSCVVLLQNLTFLSTGTPGSNISTDGGSTWKQIDTESYNVCQKAKNGTLVLFAGDKGKIGILKP